MKGTEIFKETIKAYLDERAEEDALFAVTYAKEGKNIDDCVTYILNTVKESECHGFADKEIYSMAVHYYDEEITDVGSAIDMQCVVNHTVELTDKEKEEAKANALKTVEKEQISKLKTGKKRTTNRDSSQQSLF